MSKWKTIDAFFKKKDVSNSEIRTLVAIETNVDISMPDEHPVPSKCSRIQFEEIDRDLGSRKQICEFSINKQDEIQWAYLKEGLYQLKNIDNPYNDDTHCRRFQPSWFELAPHVKIPDYALAYGQVVWSSKFFIRPSFCVTRIFPYPWYM